MQLLNNMDLDGNGKVDVKDAQYLLFYTFYPSDYNIPDEALNYVDINKDGKVDDSDAKILLDKYKGMKLYDESIFLNRPNSYGIIPKTNEKVTS